MRKALLLIFPALLLVACQAGKQALKLMEKQKYEEARTKLEQALPKDSLNADLLYVYSLLYTDSANQAYDIDTAYFFINRAREAYVQTDPREKDRQYKAIRLDSAALSRQQQRLDSLAFLRARSFNTIAAYQTFVDTHAGAAQLADAIRIRNRLAYQAALQQDTYEAYKTFMDTYPEAEQYVQARERYNTLVFRARTREGDLQSYLDFLESFPDSPYRGNAEKNILEISTAANHFDAYLDFIQTYPNSPHTSFAVNLLFHLYRDKYGADAFFNRFRNLPLLDSLLQAQEVSQRILAPIFEQARYGMIDSRGNYAVETAYSFIPGKYLCRGVTTDLLHLADSKGDGIHHFLLTKTGEEVFSYSGTENINDNNATGMLNQTGFHQMGGGLMLVNTQEDRYRLLHQSGRMLLDAQAIDTALVLPAPTDASPDSAPYQFIKFARDGRWGLATFTGRTLLRADYDEIEDYESFIALRKDGRIAITNRTKIAQIANQRPLELSFIYEDVALMGQDYLVAYTDKYESVLDKNLDVVVPLDNYSIVRPFDGDDPRQKCWLLRSEEYEAYVSNDSLLNRRVTSYFLYQKGATTDPKTYREAYFSNGWLALQDQDGYIFYDFDQEETAGRYDSVKLIGNDFALLFTQQPQSGADSVQLRFRSGRSLALGKAEELNFLLLRSNTAGEGKEYLMVAPRRGDKKIYAADGKLVLEGDFSDVKVYNDLFVIEQKRRKGLVNRQGKTILPNRYEAIGNYRDSLLALFRNGKFGTYHHASGTRIEPAYENMLQAYGPSLLSAADSAFSKLFIAKKDGALGIVNQDNETLAPFTFDEITYWNDTSALVRQENQWLIYGIPRFNGYDQETDYTLYSGIDDFSIIEETDEEKVLKIYKEGGYGIISNRKGELLGPTYDDIRLLGSVNDPQSIYMAEKYVPEADLYIVIHINTSGSIIKRQALTPEQYDRVFCEEA
jgi:hypothetical protein